QRSNTEILIGFRGHSAAHQKYGQGLGFQFKMSVIVDAAPSSVSRLTRNRWPSDDTAYCCLLTPGSGPPAMRTGNRTAGLPVSRDRPSGDNFTGAAINLLSNDT